MSEGGYYASGMGADSRPAKQPWVLPACTDPDRRPAQSGCSVDSRGADLLWVLNVEGHGALVLRAGTDHTDPQGHLVFKGVSIFTKLQIETGNL